MTKTCNGSAKWTVAPSTLVTLRRSSLVGPSVPVITISSPASQPTSGVVTSMLAARLSRQDEYEADAYAAALLTKAGIGTGPQKALFQKLETLTGMDGRGAPAWLMSHPRTADRIAAIEGFHHNGDLVAIRIPLKGDVLAIGDLQAQGVRPRFEF